MRSRIYSNSLKSLYPCKLRVMFLLQSTSVKKCETSIFSYFSSTVFLVADRCGWHMQKLLLIKKKKILSAIPVIKKTVCISDEEEITYHKIFTLPRRAAIYRQFNSNLILFVCIFKACCNVFTLRFSFVH